MEFSLAELETQIREDPKMRRFFDLAREYQKMGRFDEAVGICEKGLDQNPNHWQARILLAQLYLAGDRLEDAHGMVERVLKALPENVAANHLAADIYYSQGEKDLALRHYQIVELFDPGKAQVKERIGRIKGESGHHEASDALAGGEAGQSPGRPDESAREAEAGPVAEAEEDPAHTVMLPVPPVESVEDSVDDAPASANESSDVWEIPDMDEDPLALESSALSQPDFLRAGSADDQPLDEDVETDRMATLTSETSESETDVEERVYPSPEIVEDTADVSLNTMTLAELYEKQGYPEKAIEIYQRILLKEPESAAIRERISRLMTGMAGVEQEGPAVQEVDVRKAVRSKRIELLEGWLRRIREGANV
jgi:tetratricopeptide (TPR) repeat protein